MEDPNFKVRKLILKNCSINDEVLEMIVNCLTKSKTLCLVDFSYNFISEKGLQNSLEKLSLAQKSKISLDVSNNNLYKISELDNFINLRYLALRGNHLQIE
jgi:hypothetical protein